MADEKQVAGEKACDFIREGTIIGLGTGTTVYYTIQKLGSLVKEGFQIKAVSTSVETTRMCRALHIPLISLTEVDELDLTIDGADYVDPAFNGIKGGHGALLVEKIVASYSRKNIWVIASSKLVKDFTNSILPLEVCPVGYKQLLNRLIGKGFDARLRLVDNQLFLTDLHNYIIDIFLKRPFEPDALDCELKKLTGVFETGLFVNMADTLIVGRGQEVEVLHRPES